MLVLVHKVGDSFGFFYLRFKLLEAIGLAYCFSTIDLVHMIRVQSFLDKERVLVHKH